MPFGLANAPSSFQNFINDILRNNILDIFVTAYINDILVFSKTLKEHRQHVKTVLSCLQAAGLQLDIDKCKFEVYKTKYLGLIIQSASPEGHSRCVKMDPVKTSAINTWKSPKYLNDVQGFLGFANFYKRFIKDFAKLASFLTSLTRKDKEFQWTPIEEIAFQAIKKAFSSAPVLLHFDLDKQCTVETDASNYISGAILSQPDYEGILRPVAFMSCWHLSTKYNYKIDGKELMVIVQAFEKWRPELESSPKPINIISDHKNLEYFMSSKRLSRCQARWSKFLSRLNFKISYRPGAQCKANALTKRSQDLLSDSDPHQDFMEQVMLKPKNLSSLQPIQILHFEDILPIEALDQDLETIISQAYQDVDPKDPVAIISQMILNGERHSCQYFLSDYSLDNKCLYHHGKLYLSNQESLRLRKNLIISWPNHDWTPRSCQDLWDPPAFILLAHDGQFSVSTSGTVTHAQEPSLQGIDKKSYFFFGYRYNHEKTLPWTLSQRYQCLWMPATHIHIISGLPLTVGPRKGTLYLAKTWRQVIWPECLPNLLSGLMGYFLPLYQTMVHSLLASFEDPYASNWALQSSFQPFITQKPTAK